MRARAARENFMLMGILESERDVLVGGGEKSVGFNGFDEGVDDELEV